MARNQEEPIVYIIPKNFIDSGYVLGGRFKTRNFIEGVFFVLPIICVFYLAWKYWNWDTGNAIAYCIIVSGGLFLAAAGGVNGDSLLEFVSRVFSFRRKKRIAKYNPRVKLEAEPDYLMREKGSIPKEKLMELVNGWSDAFLGNDGPISRDIHDEKLIVYFADDEGLVEKPAALKTKKERRMETKAAKKAARARAKEVKKLIRRLPRKERRIQRKAFRLEEHVRREEEKGKRRSAF